MTPRERAENCTTVFNAGSVNPFPGRPLLEGLIEKQIIDAVRDGTERVLKMIRSEADYQLHIGRVQFAGALRALITKIESGPKPQG